MKIEHNKMCGIQLKVVFKGKFKELNAYTLEKRKKSQINFLSSHLENLERKISQNEQKEIIKESIQLRTEKRRTKSMK